MSGARVSRELLDHATGATASDACDSDGWRRRPFLRRCGSGAWLLTEPFSLDLVGEGPVATSSSLSAGKNPCFFSMDCPANLNLRNGLVRNL